MRRFLALVFVLGLAIPAGISLEGCTRNPGAKTCNGLGYGLKVGDLASLTLQPQTAGISLAYGQTLQAQTPTGATCKGSEVSVSGNSLTYGTSNNQIADISPTGSICAGTWNRNTGGGIADYTYCNAPSPLPANKGLPYAVAYITASAQSVTSNPVAIYVHAPISSISLVGPQQCLSQTQTAQLDAEACFFGTYNGVPNQYELCAPSSVVSSGKYACPGGAPPNSNLQSCNATIGTMNFTLGTSTVASINATTNVITATAPGTTSVSASIAQSASSAGYFSTCPPASISVTLPNGSTSGTVTQGVPQNLATTVVDTNGKTITGLTLTYQSTNPIDITANASGTISAAFPGVASITAVCQPVTCNPAPTNVTGFNGTGLAVSSNPANITVPGTASDFVWFAAPGMSQYFTQIQLLTGTLGSTVRLPYVPNSMVMDKGGNELYFGSVNELMVYNTLNNGLGTQEPRVPGVVLAVSPDNTKVLVNDQARHLFYLYGLSDTSIATFPGMGNAAQWTADSQTLYITDNALLNTPASCGVQNITGHVDALYVYDKNLGWTTYALPASPLPADQIPPCSAKANVWAPTQFQTPAITIPGVGAYLRGAQTQAHTWCPSGTVGNQATIQYFPQGDNVAAQSDSLASTVDGSHVLGAQWNAGGTLTLNDIAVTVPTGLTGSGIATPLACPLTTNSSTGVQTMAPLKLTSTVTPVAVSGVTATSVSQVITGATPVPPSGGVGTSLAFITYNGTTPGAQLPFYLPATGSGAGTLGYVPLTGRATITAPVAGAFNPDNTLFFVSTAGDNKIHYISIPNAISGTSQPVDKQQIAPNLPACNPSTDTGCLYNGTGTVVPTTAIAVKPRSVT